MEKPVHYNDYLLLDNILTAQQPESFKEGKIPAHDEMLFIIIHQAYELWFKQILFELNSVKDAMRSSSDEAPFALQVAAHRLERIATILKLLVQQIDVMETMTPMDFLDFRDMLRPASGFQSWQFKQIEATLGLRFDDRYGQQHYTSQLREKEVDLIQQVERDDTILSLLNTWLEAMPFINDEMYWVNYKPVSGNNEAPVFWKDYEYIYINSLAPQEKQNEELFKATFNSNAPTQTERQLSAAASRSALFIFLYRGFQALELPFELLEKLLEIDNQLGNWRYRHMNMVRRMIGSRIGTGNSSGATYLKNAMDKHYIFKEIAQLNSFLIDRKKLPILPKELTDRLGYQRF